MTEFRENRDGVHIMNPVNGEYTLCGDAFDAPGSESDWTAGSFAPTRKRRVTCAKCRAVVLACRGVEVGPARAHSAEAAP